MWEKHKPNVAGRGFGKIPGESGPELRRSDRGRQRSASRRTEEQQGGGAQRCG